MVKLATLTLNGDLSQNVVASLSISCSNSVEPQTNIEISGDLPSNPLLATKIERWCKSYYRLGDRITPIENTRSNRAKRRAKRQAHLRDKCRKLGKELHSQLHIWLKSDSFSPIRDRWLQQLMQDEVRVLIRTSSLSLLKLPWQLWDLVELNPLAEVAFGAPNAKPILTDRVPTLRSKVKVLAILGDSRGIKIEEDRNAFTNLADAEIKFLLEPTRLEVNDHLCEQDWDILFFAGHSRTEGKQGIIYINQTDSLTLSELRYGLRKAIERGLQLAIFNSCDGMGLAFELQQLNLPQTIVMRAPVPDLVAQKFLRYFLPEFVSGQSLYLAERSARQRLQGLEDKFPSASWLPVIFQSPATTPPTWAELGHRPTELCPYRGLFAFREEDAQFFHGREIFTQDLVAAVQRYELVCVIGASGSGKSSVVFAGLVPELRSQQRSWEIVAFRPGQRPFQSIATAWVKLRETDRSQADRLPSILQLAEAWRMDEEALQTAIKTVVRESPGTKLLFIIDQFEELYTQCQDKQERQAFIDRLLKVAKLDNIALVLTLRTDFLGQVLKDPPLANIISDSDRMLGAMSRTEIQAAIVQPAALLGVTLEQGLAGTIAAVSEAAGNLPLLEFALQELWEKRQGIQLTHAAYNEIGGLEAAVARYAEHAYLKLARSERDRVRKILLQLVRPGEGAEDTRRLATRAEIGERDWELVTRLASDRLVVTGQDPIAKTETVELVHEALIQEWQRLKSWMGEDRTFRLWQEELRRAKRQWETSDRDEDALLRGKPLINAEYWLEKCPQELMAEQEFITASVRLREKELEQKQKIRKFLGAIILLVPSFITIISVYQLNQTRQGQIEALNTSSQNSLLANDQLGSLVASVKASKLLNMFLDRKQLQDKTLETLEQAVYAVHEQNRLQDDDWVEDIDFSPDSETIVTAGDNHKIELWKSNGTYLKTLGNHTDRIYSINFSPDGQKIVSASRDKTVKLWNLQGQLLTTLKGHTDRVKWARFSPDGTTIASASLDRTVKLWNLQGQLLTTLAGHTRDVESVSFSPDGQTLASGGLDGKIILWNRKGELKKKWEGHVGGVFSTTFSSDGQTLVTAGKDRKIKLWDLNGKILKTFEGHTDGVNSISFSPDGQMLASASRDKSVKLWSRDGVVLATFKGHKNSVTRVKFSPDGQTLASASWDKSVKLWNIHNQQNLVEGLSFIPMLQPQNTEIRSINFSPNGQMIASSGNDGIAKIWDRNGNLIKELRGHRGPVRKVVFSPNSKTIATAGDDETILLWNPLTGKKLKTFKGHKSRVYGINFSPNGQMIASAGDDKTIRLWKVEDGSSIGVLRGHQDFVVDVVFSPDGKTIATASDDKTVKLWNLDRTLLTTLNHKDEANSVSFSPDGKMIVTTSDDRQVRLYTRNGKEASEPLKSDDREIVARFSPDGKMIASSGFDKKVKLWKPDGTLINTFNRHEDFIWDLSFSPDSKIVVSSSSDKTIKVWPVKQKEDTSSQFKRLIKGGCEKLTNYLNNSSSSHKEDRHLCDRSS
jgi:WD40 repeat protein